MIGLGTIPAESLKQIREQLESPKCPAFPDASVGVARFASWAYSFARWLALPMGPFRRVFWAISSRASKVEWSRTPYQQRLLCMAGCGLVGVMALMLGFGRGPSSPGRL